MNCSDVQYMMPLYLSGELDSISMAQFDRHAAECPACSRRLEEHLDLETGIRSALLSEPVDATALRGRVRVEMQRETKHAVTGTVRHPIRIGLAIAAMVLIGITLGLAYRDNARYEQASADHVDEVVMGRPKEWRTQDQSIGQLVAQRVDTPTNLRQLSIPSYQLLRGKECALAQKRYVHLVYGNGPTQISMYVLEGNEHGLLRRIATSLLPTVRSRAESGYNVTEGDANGHRILLVSTLPQTEEQTIVKNMLQTMG